MDNKIWNNEILWGKHVNFEKKKVYIHIIFEGILIGWATGKEKSYDTMVGNNDS